MPYIIKNGKTYTGNSVTLTQAQYDALSEAEKNNGVAYYIYDSDTVLDASDVGLGEGNVEDLAGSVAVIETSPATAIHAVGDFILWNGQLYTVTSAIAVGQALTVGSNITATSAGSELSSLKAGLLYFKNVQRTVNQNNTVDVWNMNTSFPAKSGYSRVIFGLRSSNQNVAVTGWQYNENGEPQWMVRKLSTDSSIPNVTLYATLIYLPDSRIFS